MVSLKQQKKIVSFITITQIRALQNKLERKVKLAESQICVGMTCDSAIKAVCYLGEVVIEHGQSSLQLYVCTEKM